MRSYNKNLNLPVLINFHLFIEKMLKIEALQFETFIYVNKIELFIFPKKL